MTVATLPIPGPQPLPLFGNALEFRHGIFEAMKQGFATYGDIFRLQLGQQELIAISHPALAQQVLVEHGNVFPKAENPLSLILGNGLVTNPDHQSWLMQRRMMQPMFHRQRLAAMGDKMVVSGQRLLESWQNKTTINLDDEMMAVTLDIITQTMFSSDLRQEVTDLGSSLQDILHFLENRFKVPIKLPLDWKLPSHVRFHEQKNALEQMLLGVITKRRAGQPQGDLLDMLLEARDADTFEGMSDQQVLDEVLTMYVAGHETTAHTLTFAFYALSQHPTMLAKLHQELETVLQGRAPKLEDLPNLPYSKLVFEETLRHYPAAGSTTTRLALEDTDIGGYSIKKGAWVAVNIYNIHHHPKFWSEPNEFRPERFLNRQEKHQLEFMPFGAGARKCIGFNLALMEGQLLLAQIAQKYNLIPQDNDLELEQSLTLQPKNPIIARLEPR